MKQFPAISTLILSLITFSVYADENYNNDSCIQTVATAMANLQVNDFNDYIAVTMGLQNILKSNMPVEIRPISYPKAMPYFTVMYNSLQPLSVNDRYKCFWSAGNASNKITQQLIKQQESGATTLPNVLTCVSTLAKTHINSLKSLNKNSKVYITNMKGLTKDQQTFCADISGNSTIVEAVQSSNGYITDDKINDIILSIVNAQGGYKTLNNQVLDRTVMLNH